MSKPKIVILGVFVADTAYRASRQPAMGETLIGSHFALGPGGKGSNQSVAAAMAGGDTHFITRLGQDDFANMALDIWHDRGVTPHVTHHPESYTGAAYIFIDQASGNNAIIVAPGAAADIDDTDLERCQELIADADIFMTQLEQPLAACVRGLEMARTAGAITILNPAPAQTLDRAVLSLCDYVTPNEIEAEQLTGIPVQSVQDAEAAAAKLIEMGAKAAVITLGENGAFYFDGKTRVHQPAFNVGPVAETTGAGDAFNGALAVALGEKQPIVAAMAFACATASISVTRPGTARAMPSRDEIDALIGGS